MRQNKAERENNLYQKNDFGLSVAAFCAMLELLKGQEERACPNAIRQK
jgi:hypothetical protein